MYSVFLVDDESLIRDGIREMVEWGEYGFTFAGEAADGELAWPLIQKLHPDIVITDIKMPFMDGLELSRLIRREMPDTTVLIISGYDEFSYAKEALTIGVSEYLLKPVSKKQLVEVLSTIKTHKDEARKLEQNRNEQMQEHIEAARRNLLDSLFNGRRSVPELLDRAKKLNLNLVAESYSVVYILWNIKDTQAADPLLLVAIQRQINAAFPKNDHVFWCNVGANGIAFLVTQDIDQIQRQTDDCITQLQAICASLETDVEWVIERGDSVFRVSSIPECFQQIQRRAYQNKLDQMTDGFGVPAADFDPNTMHAEQFDQRTIEKFLSVGQKNGISDFVEDYFTAIGNEAMNSLLFRQYFVLHIQFSINAFLERMNAKDESGALCRTPSPSTDEITTLSGAKSYLTRILTYVLNIRDHAADSKYSGILRKAIDFMNEHFSNPDISLNAVAQVVNVRSTYFSAMFSQQMGKTFVEYLTELRMEKAKTLLRCTDKSSGDIAFEVGYNDPHYFSFLFKKVNGCSPRDYRAGKE